MYYKHATLSKNIIELIKDKHVCYLIIVYDALSHDMALNFFSNKNVT